MGIVAQCNRSKFDFEAANVEDVIEGFIFFVSVTPKFWGQRK